MLVGLRGTPCAPATQSMWGTSVLQAAAPVVCIGSMHTRSTCLMSSTQGLWVSLTHRQQHQPEFELGDSRPQAQNSKVIELASNDVLSYCI